MLHKMKFIISRLIAPGPKIKPNYNHRDLKGKIGSHTHLQRCQVGRGWAGSAEGSSPAPAPHPRPVTSPFRHLSPPSFLGVQVGPGSWGPSSPTGSLAPVPASPQALGFLHRCLSFFPFPTWTFSFFFLNQNEACSPAAPHVGGLSPLNLLPGPGPASPAQVSAPGHFPPPAAAHPRTPRC